MSNNDTLTAETLLTTGIFQRTYDIVNGNKMSADCETALLVSLLPPVENKFPDGTHIS